MYSETVWMQYYSMSVWWRFWHFLRFIEKCLRVSLFRTAGGNLRRAPESNIGDSSAGGITEWLNGFNAQSGSIWRLCIHLQAHFRKSLSSISHLLCSILWWIWWITAKLQLKRHPNCWMVNSQLSKSCQHQRLTSLAVDRSSSKEPGFTCHELPLTLTGKVSLENLLMFISHHTQLITLLPFVLYKYLQVLTGRYFEYVAKPSVVRFNMGFDDRICCVVHSIDPNFSDCAFASPGVWRLARIQESCSNEFLVRAVSKQEKLAQNTWDSMSQSETWCKTSCLDIKTALAGRLPSHIRQLGWWKSGRLLKSAKSESCKVHRVQSYVSRPPRNWTDSW